MKTSNCAKRLNELIEMLNITQYELAEKTGIDPSTISLYCTGKRTPRQDKIALICDCFDINPSWLLGYDVEMRDSQIDDGDKVVSYLLNTDKGKKLIKINEYLENMSSEQLNTVLDYVEYLIAKSNERS